MIKHHSPIKAIFIGTSAGGVTALNSIFKVLPPNFKLPIIVVLHLGDKKLIPSAFHPPKGVTLREADEKDPILPQHIYFAPAGYHLLVESDQTFSLSTEGKVQYARPSLDVTMDTMAQAYGSNLVGVILTGANEDGADGLLEIKKHKGMTIAQTPESAEYDSMPKAAIRKADPDFILSVPEIGSFLAKLEGTV